MRVGRDHAPRENDDELAPPHSITSSADIRELAIGIDRWQPNLGSELHD